MPNKDQVDKYTYIQERIEERKRLNKFKIIMNEPAVTTNDMKMPTPEIPVAVEKVEKRVEVHTV